MNLDSSIEVTFAGSPNAGHSFEPRYFLPALARVLGGSDASWAAASWVILSSACPRNFDETPRQYWRRIFSHARRERVRNNTFQIFCRPLIGTVYYTDKP